MAKRAHLFNKIELSLTIWPLSAVHMLAAKTGGQRTEVKRVSDRVGIDVGA